MKIKYNKRLRAAKVAVAVVVSLIVGTPSLVSADSNSLDRARAKLRTVNDSGIRSWVNFRANGSELKIFGKAKGMDPNVFYVSLVYDILSVATGDFACEPGFDFSDPFLGATEDAPGRLNIFEMGIDASSGAPQLIWVARDDDDVDGEPRRTVKGTVNVNLDRIRTISIRDTSINDGVGPQAVVACGLIVPKK